MRAVGWRLGAMGRYRGWRCVTLEEFFRRARRVHKTVLGVAAVPGIRGGRDLAGLVDVKRFGDLRLT